MERKRRFAIGTKYQDRKLKDRIYTVIDYLTTKNMNGDIVKERYLVEHEFSGQMLTSEQVDTSIARHLWATGDFDKEILNGSK